METKLRLNLARIHWSLALKALALSVVWLVLPGWAFLVLSFYFYFIPIFHPWKLFLPFLVFLFLASLGPANFGFAVILAVLFYIILGIKDLNFINRRPAYDNLVLVLTFLLDIWFFSAFGDSGGFSAIVSVFLLSAVLVLLYKESLAYGQPLVITRPAGKVGIALGLWWLIVSEMSLAVLFLPVNFLYQSALLFFPSAILMGLISSHLDHAVTRQRILVNFSVAFVFFVLILGSVEWGL